MTFFLSVFAPWREKKSVQINEICVEIIEIKKIGAIHRTLIWNDHCQALIFLFFYIFLMTLSDAGCFDDESV